MRRAGGAGLGVALGLWAGLAQAADLRPPAPAPAEGPTYTDWSGPYLGVEGSAGASFGNYRFGPSTVGGRAIPAFQSGDSTRRSDAGRTATTAVGGLFGGYNWQTGPYLYGIEADLYGANLKRPVPSTALGFGYEDVDPAFSVIRAKTDLYGALRARLGYAFESYLVYANLRARGRRRAGAGDLPGRRRGHDGDGAQGPVLPRLHPGGRRAIRHHPQPRARPRLPLHRPRSVRPLRPRRGAGARPRRHPGRVLVAPDDGAALLVPYGLRLPAEVAEDAPASRDTGRYSFHGQTTFVMQGVPGFRAPYRGENSLVPNQVQSTTTATLFLGVKLTDSTELYYNPEFSQGFGLSRTLGVAGFVNGEAQKAGAPFPKLRSNRYFIRQTFGLGGATEDVPDGVNQVAMTRDVERISVVAGKFALGDFFDGNVYAHDPRVDFMNWSIWGSSAWDFPANLPGFTQGVMVEYNRPEFAIRAAYTQVPKQPSNDVLDPRVFERAGTNIEFEERHVLPGLDQPGKLRIGLFSNVGNTANYRQVVDLTQGGVYDDINDAAAATRRPRRKTGAYINLEQALTPDLGLFARASVSDGRNESLSFTDVDRSVSGGLSLKGTAWERPSDTVGIGGAINGLSPSHRAYFANGGLGLLIGDGRLTYGTERAFETYYALSLTKAVTVSFNYQLVVNPAYNRDRGPANFFGTRLHADF